MTNAYNNIPKEKFNFADPSRRIGDKKLSTRRMSFAKDVFRRFCRNKSSVVAAVIIALLVLFAILGPIAGANDYTRAPQDTKYLEYGKLLPKSALLSKIGILDGGQNKTKINQSTYNYYKAIELETGDTVIMKDSGAYKDKNGTTRYDIRYDSYVGNGMTFFDLTEKEFKDIQAWQNETGIQVIYPAVNNSTIPSQFHTDANVYYETDRLGAPVMKNGEVNKLYLTTGLDDGYDSLRIEGDDGSYRYAKVGGTSQSKVYTVRAYKYTYYQYRYGGEEPAFLFGTNALGQDIFTRLAGAARFSFVFAICIASVNLFLGAIIGALEGYYGGVFDLIMERIIDILGGVPSMVVMSLFQLHLANKVGPVLSMFFAFVLTGWIGMSARTRMQFYRFKNSEYVLSARTLGASDGRLMFKHIFPNAMGTLITGSVLVIPGVIFSESSLTFLGIVNLDSSTMTSVGTMIANGRQYLATEPHIILFPALFISLLEISFNLFGNGLRDAFNPSLKGVED